MLNKIIIAFALLMGSLLAAWGQSRSLSNLSSGNPISNSDLFYDVQTSGMGGVKVTGSQLLNYVFGNISGNCGASPTGVLTCSGLATSTLSSIAAGTNITTSGTATNTTINVIATPTFTSITTTLASVTGWLTTSGVNMQTASIAGNLTAAQGSVSGWLTASGVNVQTLTVVGSLTAANVNVNSALNITTGGTVNTAAFQTYSFGNLGTNGLGISIAHNPAGSTADLQFVGAQSTSNNGTFFDYASEGNQSFVALRMFRNIGTVDAQFGVAGGAGNFFADAPSGGATFSAGTALMFGVGSQTGAPESTMVIPSAAKLRIHNGTTPTVVEIYNTTDNPTGTPTNYERANLDWTSTANNFTIGTNQGGTGVGRNVLIIASGTRAQTISATATTFAAALNAPAIAQLGGTTTGYACWTTGTGAISEDSTTCLASLRALKKDIAPFTDTTSELMALKPSQFQWKNPADANQRGQQLGFIAEDVHDVDARLSSYAGDGSLHGWRQDAMIAALVRGFQEQQAVIREQQAQIDDLKRRLH